MRQSQRERDRSLDEVAAVLWERYVSLANQTSPRGVSSDPLAHLHPEMAVVPTPVTNGLAEAETLQDELFKVGSLQPNEPISLATAFKDAMDVVARLVEGRGAHVEISLPEGLPSVRVHRVVLRQVLIDLLESAIENQIQTPIRVTAHVVADNVRLEISVPRPHGALPPRRPTSRHGLPR